MAVSDADIEFVCDLFSGAGRITTRKMMGGLSIYCDGDIFAIQTGEGRLMLRATADLADDLAELGGAQFRYERKDGRASTMRYWDLPGDSLDDPDLAADWARRSLANSAKYP